MVSNGIAKRGPRSWGLTADGRSWVRVAALCRAPWRRVKRRRPRPVRRVIDFAPCLPVSAGRAAARSPPCAAGRPRVAPADRHRARASPRPARQGRRHRPRPIVPGASGSPREVNLIAKDYSFLPDALDLAPGETVLLHVINGGLEVHEAVIGDARVQDAWEVAEAATVGAPPGPTPVVSVPPEVARPADRRPLRGTRGCRLDGPGRDSGRGVAGRLPHPRSLGARDAHPGALGRRRPGLLSAPDDTLGEAPRCA